jgi:hypothetical protein
MIAEARADNKDNDVEFMKPGSGRCKHITCQLAWSAQFADKLLESNNEYVQYCMTSGEEFLAHGYRIASLLIQILFFLRGYTVLAFPHTQAWHQPLVALLSKSKSALAVSVATVRSGSGLLISHYLSPSCFSKQAIPHLT